METYLTLLYVTLEQEQALKDLFIEKGWTYCKPDLGVFTDRVGPVETPQCVKTKSGRVITYSELSSYDADTNNRQTNKRKTKGKTIDAVVDDTVVKVVVTKGVELTSELPAAQTEVMVEQVIDPAENDDGDNDDDFADDILVNSENETVGPIFMSPHKKHAVGKSLTKNVLDCLEGNSAAESSQDNCLPSRRKRRKVAASNKESQIEAGISNETDLNPVVLKTDCKVKTEKPTVPGVKLKCDLCPREFTYQFNLNRHHKLVHDPDNPPKERARRSPKSHQCDICGYVLSRSDTLLEHKRVMHEGKPPRKPRNNTISQHCVCEFCGSKFTRKEHLKEHILMKHPSSPVQLPYACNLCEKSFIRPKFLQLHINRDHLKSKPFGCQFCDKKFYSETYANRHMKIKVCQPDSEKKFKCILCEKRYPEANNLACHMAAKHFNGAYTCVCGKTVKWASSVSKHKRKCKEYIEYAATNSDTSDKLCNVIEVMYSDVVDDSKTVTESTNVTTDAATKDDTILSELSGDNISRAKYLNH